MPYKDLTTVEMCSGQWCPTDENSIDLGILYLLLYPFYLVSYTLQMLFWANFNTVYDLWMEYGTPVVEAI